MRGRVLGAAALAAALAIGTTACGGGNPKPAPASDSSPSNDASGDTGQAEAVRTARLWIDALNASSESLDASSLRKLSTRTCEACGSIADYITQIGSQGGKITGGEWLDPKFTVRRASNDFVVRADILVKPQQIRESRSSAAKQFPGGADTPKQFTVTRSGGKWLVSKLEQEDTL
ncbi:hypothetical protein GCM10011519_31840 [Marmoricola endophyticus]|uniref:Lipoprotein n=1 Tax=Marmoricola endophyticus TaxID=2040280 RepID=A0A917F806_9ACTN|nr:hypothetical protein [Marmoricola endophyticus]GGF55567.1 hypothetical protein GCM10011519_31840 [Marmoricola endophyticus]